MDWKRAKTMLIVVFVIINVFLIWQLSYMNSGQVDAGDNSSIDGAISYLKEHQIEVQCDVPAHTVNLPILTATQNLYTTAMIKEIFFNNINQVEVTETGDSRMVKYGNVTVLLNSMNELTYTNSSRETPSNSSDEKACQKVIDDFLTKAGINTEIAYIINKSYKDGKLAISYGQAYKDVKIDNSYIEIKADANKVFSAKVQWLDSIKSNGKGSPPIAPSDLLIRLAPQGKALQTPVVIKGIEQRYYWDVSINKDYPASAAKNTAASPVWALTTDQGMMYQNIQNGNIENEGL